ncbi:hypothetical protein EDB86DRAFT_2968008 [Lactarius hatsudake]|nr:hypothetical protein EDB86DRAFT_2968008 [Lactarius hatsudake]
MLRGTFFPPPSRPPSGSTKGSAIVPCCLHASLLVRFGLLPSLHHHLGSPGDPRPRTGRSKTKATTRSRDGRVGWRDVALAMLCSEPQIRLWRPLWIKWLCGTHLSIGGRSSWRSQLLRKSMLGPYKWRLPFCGYIYWAIRLFTGSTIHHPAPTAHPRFLPASCCPGYNGFFGYLRLAAFVCLCLVSALCPIGLLLATARTSVPRSRFEPMPTTAASSPRDLGSSYRA